MANKTLNQAIRMAGFPQLIVTRAFAYRWLAANNSKKFADMYAFTRPAVNEPLTDAAIRDEWLREIA